ncbi:MAG: protein kinase [Chloroflexi bacterium]|nr:protein kinase [Chloroflexota bacterium]
MLIGQTLKNRYRVYDELGTGGAATVYLARDSASGQMVVVKLVHPHLVDDEFMGRFMREIDLLQQLNNPHIVKLYDWAMREWDENVDQSLSYIVAEFIEGHTLADLIDTRGAFGEREALTIARQLATALKAIHSRGVIHRDIKSQNIMITPDGDAKLIDFGIAKGKEHATLTAPSHFAGTLHYAPAEQILESRDVDHRADLYSLGVVLYEMLTASLPIKAREFGTIASKIIAGDLDPIRGVSEDVEELVNYMLAMRVTERIPSAQAVIEHIDSILEPRGGTDTGPVTALVQTISPGQLKRGPILISDDGKRIPLIARDMVIGRSHPSDPHIPDIDLQDLGFEDARTASRRHARIFTDGRQYYVEDLDSTNGTRINGEDLEPNNPIRISEGDQLEIGRVRLVFTRS